MRLVLNARARSFLRRLPRTNVYSALELMLLVLLAVQFARLFWALVTPIGPIGAWRPATVGFTGSPIAVLQGFDPFFRSAGAATPDKAAVVTSLQLILFGTRLDEANGGGSAIIAGPDGVQLSVGVGQEIMPGVTLKAVAFDHVTIDRGGTAEDLFLVQGDAGAPPPAPPAVSLDGTTPSAPATPPGRGPVTMQQLRSDIGFIPRVDGGKVSGLVVRAQGSGAAFRQANLRDGDVVVEIGGRPVSGPGDIDRLGAQYGGGGQLPITVERGSERLPLVIAIASQ